MPVCARGRCPLLSGVEHQRVVRVGPELASQAGVRRKRVLSDPVVGVGQEAPRLQPARRKPGEGGLVMGIEAQLGSPQRARNPRAGARVVIAGGAAVKELSRYTAKGQEWPARVGSSFVRTRLGPNFPRGTPRSFCRSS